KVRPTHEACESLPTRRCMPPLWSTTMKFNRRKFSRAFALAILAIGTLSQAARAGDLSAQQIVDGLKAPKTRSLAASSAQPAPLSAADAAFIDKVRKTRSLSSADRDQVQQIA